MYSSVNRVWTMTGDSFHCSNEGFAFVAAPGDTITGTIVSTNPSMIVYILTEQELSAWEAGNSCDPRQDNPPVGVQWADGSRTNLLQQVNLDWTAPVAGQYFLLVETFSLFSILTVDVSTPYSGVITQVLSVLATSSSEVQITSSTEAPINGYSESITPSQSYNTASQSNHTSQLALALAVVAAVVIGAAFLYSRRKQQPKITKAEKVEPQTEKVMPPKNFCIECGSELRPNSKFCDNCGTKQP